jgi:2-iminobutanoate/2-iminopropanoate deaminase
VLCTSAVSGKDAATGALPADAGDQARHAFANLRAVLEAGGADMGDIVKLSVTISDETVRGAVNEQWLASFPDARDRPARHITVHELQHGMRLQLEALAVIAAD